MNVNDKNINSSSERQEVKILDETNSVSEVKDHKLTDNKGNGLTEVKDALVKTIEGIRESALKNKENDNKTIFLNEKQTIKHEYTVENLCNMLTGYIEAYSNALKLNASSNKKDVHDRLQELKKVQNNIISVDGDSKNITQDVKKIEELLERMHSYVCKTLLRWKQVVGDDTEIPTSFSNQSLDKIKYLIGKDTDGAFKKIAEKLGGIEKINTAMKEAENYKDTGINDNIKNYIERGKLLTEKDLTMDNIMNYFHDNKTFKNKGNWFTRILSPRKKRFYKFYKAFSEVAKLTNSAAELKTIRDASERDFKGFTEKNGDTMKAIKTLYNKEIKRCAVIRNAPPEENLKVSEYMTLWLNSKR